MSKKLAIIKEVFSKNNTNNFKTIVVFTKSFKAVGEYCNEHALNNVVSLKQAKVYSFASNCECESNPAAKEIPWLNIFSKDIIAFSFVEN